MVRIFGVGFMGLVIVGFRTFVAYGLGCRIFGVGCRV